MLPVMGAEDFSFMLEACPGNMMFIGNGVIAPARITQPTTSMTQRFPTGSPIGHGW
jgi:metal-dependent amidase/aminoacylase/carboxypeptidase family protein